MRFEPLDRRESIQPILETNERSTAGKEHLQVDVASVKAQLQASGGRLSALSEAFSAPGPEGGSQSAIVQERAEAVHTMNHLKELVAKEGGMLLYHGGLPDDASLDAIDLQRLGTQQNKRGQTYGGFYLTDETSRSWSEDYARSRTGNMHGFWIAPSSRMLEVTGANIDRLSQQQRDEYAKEYDIIKGKDLLGRAQFVLLNKGVVKGLGKERI